jgi:serine/threonine protein kinase
MAATCPAQQVGPWLLKEHIGQGSFAVVWKARHRVTGEEVAVKEISTDKLNKKLRQSLECEVSILKRIEHRNIVRLLETSEVTERSCDWHCSCSRPQAVVMRSEPTPRWMALFS